MAQRLFVPRLIAAQPWQVILPLFALTLFGGAVLYSAAGGHMRPWALMHVVRFPIFLALAMALARVPAEWFKRIALPGYVALCISLVLVEAIGRIGGGSPGCGSEWSRHCGWPDPASLTWPSVSSSPG